MGNWRRDQRENFQQEWPPQPPSGWSGQPTEKRFCICEIPCQKICECNTFQSYQKVMEWNDSAGQEALQNAESRYWTEFNGLPCYVPLPDPDLYVDVIDWSSSIDHKLLSALNGERTVSEHDEDDRERQIQYSALWNQPNIPTGWGDDIHDNPVIKPRSAYIYDNPVIKPWSGDIYDNPVIRPFSTMGPMGPICENYNSYVRGHRGEENKVV